MPTPYSRAYLVPQGTEKCRAEKALDAKGLFPQVTTWLGFPRDRVLRGYMMDFIKLFAPHYSEHMIRDAAALETQELVDSFVSGLSLPVKSEREDDTVVN